MITINHEEIIDRPAADVFAFIADPTNDPQWCPPVLAAEQIKGVSPQAGARYRQTVKPGPKELTNTLEITEYRPNRRMAWRGHNRMAEFHGRYDVEPANEGARVFMSSSLKLKGLWRLLTPIISLASRSATKEEFQNLKQSLESKPAKLSAACH